jgi:hypothetical protein
LSTTTAPRAAATGAHSADTSSGTSNMAMSTPSNAAADSTWTATSAPRTGSRRPALRGEATSRMSPHGSRPAAAHSLRMDSITLPTAPVAPTTASTGLRPAFTAPPVLLALHVLANPGLFWTRPRGEPTERGSRTYRTYRTYAARAAY